MQTCSLFQVYLRLRPPPSPLVQLTQQSIYPTLPPPERYLTVEPAKESDDDQPTQITINPPSESRKRAIEKFIFTRVFEESADQLDIFKGTGVVPLVQGVLRESRDGLLATLGVTGSGKSHTMLGSRSQRGLTQLSLDLLYRSIEAQILHPVECPSLIASLSAADPSEAQIKSAHTFLESLYGAQVHGRLASRAQTPVDAVWSPRAPKRKLPARPSALPRLPDINDITLSTESDKEYAIVISMYEVYNDRIFDLLSLTAGQKEDRRRALLFKPTDASPHRKVVAGLRKIVCSTIDEASMVLETGLVERRVAGTGSNSVSSRSHGFFCIEIHKRTRGGPMNAWSSAQLTIVDLAGSERARNAKTAGATLAEAGKINESLMYLGQCLQMQSDNHDSTKCKLTELLFSNSFPSNAHNANQNVSAPTPHRNAQRAIMIVTADPLGDFNATSQILRYSALAREVTVPRIPSVTSTILAGILPSRSASGRTSPPPQHSLPVDDGMVEMAFSEIARLNEEIEVLKLRLAEEEARRHEAEINWRHAEEKAERIESEVREECWQSMDAELARGTRRWQTLREAEADRADEHLDHKLELLSRGMLDERPLPQNIRVHEDVADDAEYRASLEADNEDLLQRVRALERRIQDQSPTRQGYAERSKSSRHESPLVQRQRFEGAADQPLSAINTSKLNAYAPSSALSLSEQFESMASIGGDDENVTTYHDKEPRTYLQKLVPAHQIGHLNGQDVGTNTNGIGNGNVVGKKMRKLTARKRDFMDEDELAAYVD